MPDQRPNTLNHLIDDTLVRAVVRALDARGDDGFSQFLQWQACEFLSQEEFEDWVRRKLQQGVPPLGLLRALRMRMGWSLETIAARTTLTKGYISKVERGKQRPTRKMLEEILNALYRPVEQKDVILLLCKFAPTFEERCALESLPLARSKAAELRAQMPPDDADDAEVNADDEADEP